MGQTIERKIRQFFIGLGVELMPYFPVPKEWYRSLLVRDSEKRYASGRWAYQRDISESHRYSVIVGCADYYTSRSRRILDIGCGDGILQQRIAYSRYVGVDMNATAIAAAQSRQNENTTFVCSPAESYEPDGQFDVIVFNESLYYIPDPLAVVDRLRTFLSPDGIMIVCMFQTYLARRIWKALAQTNMAELTSAKISNEVGFSSVVRLYSNTFVLNKRLTCALCHRETFVRLAEQLLIPSDSRRWLHEYFAIWRCAVCRSLHSLPKDSKEAVPGDRPEYLSPRRLNRFNRVAFEGFARWLAEAGVGSGSRVLYCGVDPDMFQSYFRSKGFGSFDAVGEREQEGVPRGAGGGDYDAVIILDRLEVAADPWSVFQSAYNRLREGGLLIVHAPNAERIRFPDALAHMFQQPFRLHIASWTALASLAETTGFRIRKVERRSYRDTRVPFVNARAFEDLAFFKDGSQEAAFEFRFRDFFRKWWRIPRFLWLGLMGGVFRDPTTVLAVFEKPSGRRSSRKAITEHGKPTVGTGDSTEYRV